MAKPSLQPAAAPANAKRAALEQMARHTGHAETEPFAQMNSGAAVDRCDSMLSEANCLLSLLAAAFEDADTIAVKGLSSAFDERNRAVVAGALKGVATLIDLASFALDDWEGAE
jgi:hypothetical protein